MAKPLVRWRDDRRPALLNPVQKQLTRRARIIIQRLGQLDCPRRPGQSPVFDGVGRQFVDREPDGLRGFRANDNVWSTKFNTGTLNVHEGLEVFAQEIGERGSLPAVANQYVVRRRDALQTLPKPAFEFFHGPGRPGCPTGNRLDYGEQIL